MIFHRPELRLKMLIIKNGQHSINIPQKRSETGFLNGILTMIQWLYQTKISYKMNEENKYANELQSISNVNVNLIVSLSRISVFSVLALSEFYKSYCRFPTIEEIDLAGKVGINRFMIIKSLLK